MEQELKRAEILCQCVHTDNEKDFKRLLSDVAPDIVLADYVLPSYDGLSALEYILSENLRIPVIIVTGSINEETAVQCMKAGAADYILKDKLKRLGPAVLNALKNQEIRNEKESLGKELKRRERYYRSILKYMHDDIVVIAKDYTVTDINNSLLKATGIKREEVIGRKCYAVLKGYNTPCADLCPMNNVGTNGETTRIQLPTTDKTGKIHWNDLLVSPLYNENHEITHIIEVYRDITELKKVKDSLRLMSLAVDQTFSPVVMMSLEGKIDYVNAAFTALSGYSREEAYDKDICRLLSNNCNKTEWTKIMKDILDGKKIRLKLCNRKKDGSEYWVSSSFSAIRDTGGTATGILEIQEDITERLKWEKQLEDDLKEKQELLHEVYHRVNNNLQILLSLFNMQMERTAVPSEQLILKTAQSRVETMAIIENMLYSQDKVSRVNFLSLVQAVFSMLAGTLSVPHGLINLETDIAVTDIPLKTSQPLALIINEILSNCMRHAYPDGTGRVRVAFYKDPESGFILRIEDNGVGLPRGLRPAETDTTGFRLIYMLAEGQMGGEVTVRSKQGTTVEILWKEF